MWLNRRSSENEPTPIKLGGSLTGCDGTRSILVTILANLSILTKFDFQLTNYRFLIAIQGEAAAPGIAGSLPDGGAHLRGRGEKGNREAGHFLDRIGEPAAVAIVDGLGNAAGAKGDYRNGGGECFQDYARGGLMRGRGYQDQIQSGERGVHVRYPARELDGQAGCGGAHFFGIARFGKE